MFYGVSLSIDMMPECFSCFKQVSLDNPRHRTCIATSPKILMGRVVQGEYQGKQLGIANCWGDNTESLIKVKWISNSKGFTGYLPEGAALEVMTYIVLAIRAAKKAIPNDRFMHSGARSPCSNKSLKKAHANEGLTLSKHRGKGLIPISRKSEMERNFKLKGL